MATAGEIAPDSTGECVNGDATRLPFADDTFDSIIASEVMEHIPDDMAALDELARVLKPGGTIAVTIPAWLPEKVCWALSDDYHAPKAVGGHVRIYTENELRSKMRGAGLADGAAHHAHALHSPYWWLKCAVGTTNDDFPLVKLVPPAAGVGHHRAARGHPRHRAAAQPRPRQEPGRLRHQADRPHASGPDRLDTPRSTLDPGDRRCHCLRFPAS